MNANAVSQEVQTIRWALRVAPRDPRYYINNPFGGLGIQTNGALLWVSLVEDGARWDFKDRISNELGKNVWFQTGTGEGAGAWFEYSVPGNIFYAYIGRAAGFTAHDLHTGAAYAEMDDPVHAAERNVCYGFGSFRKCYYMNPEWKITGYDEPRDYNAIQFGDMLFNLFGFHIPLENFTKLLGAHGHLLDRGVRPIDADAYYNPAWPYPLGYFDGGS